MIPLMDAGDILAHPFTRHPSGFTDMDGKVHPLVFEAIRRGVMIDVGRGNHFSIRVARQVLDAGVLPDTLGADLHGYNISRASAAEAASAAFRFAEAELAWRVSTSPSSKRMVTMLPVRDSITPG